MEYGYFELRSNDLWRTTIEISRGYVTNASTSRFSGSCARVLTDRGWGFIASSVEKNPRKLVDKASEMTRGQNASQRTKLAPVSTCKSHLKDKMKVNPRDAPLDDKILALKELVKTCDLDNRENTAGYVILYNDFFSCDKFFSSDGTELKFEHAATGIVFALYTSHSGGLFTKEGFLLAPYGLEFINEDRIVNLFEEKARELKELPLARQVGSGKYPVIFDSELSGMIIHELLGHGLEADNVLGEESVFEARMNKSITIEEFSCVHDPMMEGAYGRYFYDDEGVKALKTTLVDKGVLTSFLHSRQTAGAFDTTPTGNAISESIMFQPVVRNIIIQVLPGSHSLEEMYEEVEEGLYLRSLKSPEVHYTRDSISFVVRDGYLIKSGKLQPIKDINVEINVKDLLNLMAVGNEPRLVTRHCSKNRQFVPNSTLVPPLMFKEITVRD